MRHGLHSSRVLNVLHFLSCRIFALLQLLSFPYDFVTYKWGDNLNPCTINEWWNFACSNKARTSAELMKLHMLLYVLSPNNKFWEIIMLSVNISRGNLTERIVRSYVRNFTQVLFKHNVRKDWMINRGPGFLSVIWFDSLPTTPWPLPLTPPPPHPLSLNNSIFLCVSGPAYWWGRGGGVVEDHTTARKPGSL